jgi:leucyl aminopeptidase
VQLGAERGRLLAGATMLARDLANTPPAHLTAPRFAELAQEVGRDRGIEVEVFDQAALIRLGCGGILGVNGGSADEARLIRLTYHPSGDAGAHLALVGKGIMYDSGGISLKPSDAVHATMKNDMSGAAAIFAAMTALRDLGCSNTVTGWLSCTDNVPSGTALKLGDVITIHGGTTVEVMNTDAEGRLVMADALVMAAAEHPDAIVDIATLTGACMRALGTWIAGVMGNSNALIAQVSAASDATDERTWPFPLERRYRRELDSDVADIKNMGGMNAGQITAALFLEEFTDTVPWAHIDIAGTAQADPAESWRTKGCTGFGARLLTELALEFTTPA